MVNSESRTPSRSPRQTGARRRPSTRSGIGTPATAQSVGINLTAVKVSAFALGGFIAGIGGGIYAHYTTHIEHANFGVVLATFAIAYPILGGLSNVFGTLIAVIFIQGILVEALRFMGDWRNLLFGLLIVLAMNVRPNGLFDARATRLLGGLLKGRRHA